MQDSDQQTLVIPKPVAPDHEASGQTAKPSMVDSLAQDDHDKVWNTMPLINSSVTAKPEMRDRAAAKVEKNNSAVGMGVNTSAEAGKGEQRSQPVGSKGHNSSNEVSEHKGDLTRALEALQDSSPFGRPYGSPDPLAAHGLGQMIVTQPLQAPIERKHTEPVFEVNQIMGSYVHTSMLDDSVSIHHPQTGNSEKNERALLEVLIQQGQTTPRDHLGNPLRVPDLHLPTIPEASREQGTASGIESQGFFRDKLSESKPLTPALHSHYQEPEKIIPPPLPVISELKQPSMAIKGIESQNSVKAAPPQDLDMEEL
jgi:hypothetical protein